MQFLDAQRTATVEPTHLFFVELMQLLVWAFPTPASHWHLLDVHSLETPSILPQHRLLEESLHSDKEACGACTFEWSILGRMYCQDNPIT